MASTLVTCLRRVAAGYRCVSLELVKELHRQTEAAAIVQALTLREGGVMRLIAEGLSNKDMARQLHVSEGTVKLHLHNIYCKTGVKRRVALAILAHRQDAAN